MKEKKIKTVVLAYSGGLDTSVILHWIKEHYDCQIVTFTANLGQEEDFQMVRDKARSMGVKKIFVEDLREEFVQNYVFPMFRANAVYEGSYLLGTSIARPLIAKKQIEIAKKLNADAVSHGSTGKGNDQIRFEMGFYALNPEIKVIAPWREWNLKSRKDLLLYAKKNKIPIDVDSKGGPPYSKDSNLLHISYEGGILEDAWKEPDEKMFSLTVSPEDSPDHSTYIEIGFKNGNPVSLDGKKISAAKLLARLNDLGGSNGIGRVDIVENRFLGMKSRGVYECPGGTILFSAHRAMESLTLDSKAMHLKDELMPRYAELIYNGFWFSPEREMLQSLIDESQKNVSGTVRLKLYKGLVSVVGRKSPFSLYRESLATFEKGEDYNQKDAEGFIKLNALRFRTKKN